MATYAHCLLLRLLLPLEHGVRDDPVGGHGDVHDVAVNLALHARRHAALLVRLHVDQHLRFDEEKGGIFGRRKKKLLKLHLTTWQVICIVKQEITRRRAL